MKYIDPRGRCECGGRLYLVPAYTEGGQVLMMASLRCGTCDTEWDLDPDAPTPQIPEHPGY